MKELYESILSSTNAGKYAVTMRWINKCIFLLDYNPGSGMLDRGLVQYDKDKNLLTFSESIHKTSIRIIGQIPKGITIEIGNNWVIFDGCQNLDDCKIVSPNGNSHSTCIAVVNASFDNFEWQKGAPYVMIVHKCNVGSSKGFKCLSFACTGDNTKELELPETQVKNLYYYKYGNVLINKTSQDYLAHFKTLCDNCYSFGIGSRLDPYITKEDKTRAKKEFRSLGNAIYKSVKEYYNKPTIDIAEEPGSESYSMHMKFLPSDNADIDVVGKWLDITYMFHSNKAYYEIFGGKITSNAPFPIYNELHWPDKIDFVGKIVSYVKMDLDRYKNTLNK